MSVLNLSVPAAQLSGLSAVVPDGGTKKYGEVSSVLPRRSGVPPFSFLKLEA
jgi:hypothetical protein